MSDLVRTPAEDRRQVATQIGGIEYRARDGYFQMPESHARLHRQSANLPASSPATGPVGRSVGRRCLACGFGSFFVVCSRCGGQCEREGGRVNEPD